MNDLMNNLCKSEIHMCWLYYPVNCFAKIDSYSISKICFHNLEEGRKTVLYLVCNSRLSQRHIHIHRGIFLLCLVLMNLVSFCLFDCWCYLFWLFVKGRVSCFVYFLHSRIYQVIWYRPTIIKHKLCWGCWLDIPFTHDKTFWNTT